MPEGYQTFVGKGGLSLSRGQRQRIVIARAMLKSSQILLLDETTASLKRKRGSSASSEFL
ncbi:ATP-binding cassette domain-containing protein [Paenibacillus alvei]|uniref:ATP-binding cassette domain-containing protein n=1 Tax=Paenibacillus alvei TaxID=44250 RepID=UPI0030B918EB